MKKTLLQVLGLYVFPNLKYLSKVFGTNLPSPVWSRHVGVPPMDINMPAGK